MSTETSQVDTEGFVKPSSKNAGDSTCESGDRSPKRSKAEDGSVNIKTEVISDSEKVNDAINITVKSTKETKVIAIGSSYTNSDLKNKVAKQFKIPVDTICLVYEGHALRESRTIANSKIEDGKTVHLVIKSKAEPFDPMQTSVFGLSQLGAIPGLGNMGLGSPNFVKVQKEMENALKENPDLFLQIMDNPFVQSVMENPTFLQQVVTGNSQMAEMLKANPELSQVMNDPEALRISLEQARNPELIQELIQSRIDAVADGRSEIKAGTVIKELNEDEEGSRKTPHIPSKKSEKAASANSPANLLNSPSLQNIMKEMVDNPDLVKEMFNAPYMGAMLDGLAANPEVATEIMVNNPIFANSTREQVKKMLPAFLRQMQNPEMQNFVSNPEAMAAMMNIHQSLGQLQQVAPNVFNMFPGQSPISSLLSPDRTQAPPGGPKDPTPDTFSIFMRNMVNAMSQEANTEGPPEERYKGQLDEMLTMGFLNKQENLQALIATFGDVNSAVKRVLAHGP